LNIFIFFWIPANVPAENPVPDRFDEVQRVNQGEENGDDQTVQHDELDVVDHPVLAEQFLYRTFIIYKLHCKNDDQPSVTKK
jgi:hypothetical protein